MVALLVIEILLLVIFIILIISNAKIVKDGIEVKKEIDFLIQKKNQEEQALQELQTQTVRYSSSLNQFKQECEKINLEIALKKEQYDSLDQAEDKIRAMKIQEREEWFKNYTAEQEKQLQQMAKDFTEQFTSQTREKLNLGEEVAAEVAQLKKTAQAAIEVAKVREAERTAKDFYRLQVDESALEDIKELREVMTRLNQPEVLGKLIWKVYYEKPYTDLCGRIFSKPICGIYLITNLENDMCYVGQAVNIQERWRQHIKRAIGAETPTQNKLYPAMAKFGVENFTFQVIEEVTNRSLLDAREKYWTDFYCAQEFGYCIRKG